VYGAGDSAVVLTKEQANALHAMGMLDYWELKHRLTTTTVGLVFAGSLIAFAAGGLDAAYPFAIGGCAGISYQWLLQQSVDSLPASQRLQVQQLQQQTDVDRLLQQSPGGRAIRRVLGSAGVRFMFVAGCMLTGVWALQAYQPVDADVSVIRAHEMRQMLTGLLGFFMYKVAVVGVTATPVPERQPAWDEIA
jgi:hypothetical protein